MERPIKKPKKGDVVSIPFPFSDASTTKRRPALVIAESNEHSALFCPITSKTGRTHDIRLEDHDFKVGKLDLSPCFIRPGIIATIDLDAVIRVVGTLKDQKVSEVIDKIVEILWKPTGDSPTSSAALQRGKKPFS